MKPHTRFIKYALGAAMLVAGCAANLQSSEQRANEAAPKAVTQREAGDSVFKYRRQAAELRAIAGRYELEAQQLARVRGAGDEQARRSLENANVMWAAAEEADQLAREYRRQVPHGQMN